MAVSSMTGFARAEGQAEGSGGGFAWSWELRSVNGKSFDIRFRLPPGFDVLEAPLKARLAEKVKRGSLNAALQIDERSAPPVLSINEPVLTRLIELMRGLESRIDAAPPRLDGLLALRGVLELQQEELGPEVRAARLALVAESFDQAVAGLLAARAAEGERLDTVIQGKLDEIDTHLNAAELAAVAQPEAMRIRFQRQMAMLFDSVPPLPEERLAQELALLIGRADIREELDRLAAHIAAARDLLAEGANIGRRFDFLCQEFNREANTLCSKSADLGLTRLGLALKAAIEQLREQVQNIE